MDEEKLAVGGGVDEVLAHAGDLENRLDDEGAGNHPGEGGADEGDRRDEPAAQGVADDDARGRRRRTAR